MQTDSFTTTADSLSLGIDATAINARAGDPNYTGITLVAEPAGLVLLGTAMLGLSFRRRRSATR